jgi:hypothetical protein
MNISKRHISLIGMLVVFTLLGVGTAFGSTIEGRIQGLQCVLQGKLCPVDNQDPHIAAEKNFVVVTGPDSYFLIPNVDRAILARHLMSKVRVSGETSSKYKSIKADRFEVQVNGKWKTAWTQEMEDRARRELNQGG